MRLIRQQAKAVRGHGSGKSGAHTGVDRRTEPTYRTRSIARCACHHCSRRGGGCAVRRGSCRRGGGLCLSSTGGFRFLFFAPFKNGGGHEGALRESGIWIGGLKFEFELVVFE